MNDNREQVSTGATSELNITFSIQSLINILFIIIVFFVTRQVPFSSFSPVMNVAVILMVILGLIKYKLDRFTCFSIILTLFIPLTLSLGYSILLTDNSVALAIKFYVVLLSVGLAFFIRVEQKTLRVFIQICFLQVIVMAAIFLYITIFLDSRSYLPVRFFFNEMGWGDVYTYDGVFYRIQIKGSALLVVAFILNLELKLFKRKYLVAAFLLLGVVIAGNFAFLISLSIYILYKLFTFKNAKSLNLYFIRLIVIAIMLLLISPYLIQYVSSTLEMKNERSLGTRSDQLHVLMNSLSENLFTVFLGQGLGNTLNIVTSFRDYTGDIYFELQILYVLNQLGVLFSICFVVYNIIIVFKKWGHINIVHFIYFVYISYAVTNPYILDTNHVVVIVVLNSLQYINKKSNEQKRIGSNCHTLQT